MRAYACQASTWTRAGVQPCPKRGHDKLIRVRMLHGTGMAERRPSKTSEAGGTKERPGTSAAPTEEPTNCDLCGKRLGVWFSLDNKAYCSPCFHANFWTPFQSVPSKAH